MKFGHRIQGKITGYDENGRGTLELEGRKVNGYQEGAGLVAIPFTAIGDEMSATFIRRDHGTKIAKLESLQSPGSDRVAAPCPHAGVCGGCLWQHLAYDAQLKIKLGMINAAFERAEHEERLDAVMPAPEQFHHRNRMDYVVGWNGQVGLKEYGSWNRYVDLKTCLLLNEGVDQILAAVRVWMLEHDLQPWDAKFHTGDVRYCVIREGKQTKERLITIVVKDFARISDAAQADLKAKLSPFCTSLLLGEQSLDTDISLSQKFITLVGNPWFEEVVNETRYRINPNSFFQTNSTMAGKLQDTVAEFSLTDVKDNAKLLDLYCGLGFFGINFAKRVPTLQVSGFEIDTEAIELAKHNAAANGVNDRTAFTSGPAEDLSWKETDADIVILDPPRSGLHPKVLKTVLEKKPQTIVYVSCNYHRLVEELKSFKADYRIEGLRALDLFPHTPHVEVVCKLVRMS